MVSFIEDFFTLLKELNIDFSEFDLFSALTLIMLAAIYHKLSKICAFEKKKRKKLYKKISRLSSKPKRRHKKH